MMIRKWFARLSGKPGSSLSYEYMYGHYLLASVKAFWRCRKKLNVFDFAQLIILIPLGNGSGLFTGHIKKILKSGLSRTL